MDNLHIILKYAELGIPVLPVKGKVPVIEDWPNKASTDPEVIRNWFENRPDLNVGIVTGRRSGIVVLDIDPRHGGEESLLKLEEKYGTIPATATVKTGGGGRHLYFKFVPEEGVTLRNAVAIDGFAGIDFRGDGGFVVAPPSLHETGNRYEWKEEEHDE